MKLVRRLLVWGRMRFSARFGARFGAAGLVVLASAIASAGPLQIDHAVELPRMDIGGQFVTTFDPDCERVKPRPNNLLDILLDRPSNVVSLTGNQVRVPCGRIDFVPDVPDMPDDVGDMDSMGIGSLVVTGYISFYPNGTSPEWQLDYPVGSKITVTINYPNLGAMEADPVTAMTGRYMDVEGDSMIVLQNATGGNTVWVSPEFDFFTTLGIRNAESFDALQATARGVYDGPKPYGFQATTAILFLVDETGQAHDETLAIPHSGQVNLANYASPASTFRVFWDPVSSTAGMGVEPRIVITDIQWTY